MSPLDLGFLVEGNCLASPNQNSQDGKKLSPTLPLIIITLETNLLQQQKEKNEQEMKHLST